MASKNPTTNLKGKSSIEITIREGLDHGLSNDEIFESLSVDLNKLSLDQQKQFAAEISKILTYLMFDLKDEKNKDRQLIEKKYSLFNMLYKDLLSKGGQKLTLENTKLTSPSRLVNRDNLAKAIGVLRYQNGISGKNNGYPEGKVEIRKGVFVTLNNQNHYKKFKGKYLEAINDNDVKKMIELDTQFAELIIIENQNPKTKVGYYIQINNDEKLPNDDPNNKSLEQIIENAKKCENSLTDMGYDVEYVVLDAPKGTKKYHVVRLKKNDTGKTDGEDEGKTDGEDEGKTDGGDEGKVDGGDEDKTEGDDEGKTDDYNLTAVVSDVTQSQKERIALEIEEQLKEEYRATGNWNVGKKALLSLQRGKRRKALMKKALDEQSKKVYTMNDALDNELTSAADRHELENIYKLGAGNVESKAQLDIPEVNEIAKKYLLGILDEHAFQLEFNHIAETVPALKNLLSKEKIQFSSTNILEKLKLEKAQFNLISTIASQLESGWSQDKANIIKDAIEQFMREYQKSPEFLAMFESALKDPNQRETLQKHMKHQSATMKMKVKNLNLKLDVLVGGKSAYQIDNKDREKNWLYKLGHKMDKIPRYLQVPGYLGIGVLLGIGGGAVGLGVVGTSILSTAAFSGTTGFVNFVKKWTHYSKEQNTHEKNIVTDHTAEMKRIADLKEEASNKGVLNWIKRYKVKRQLDLYNNSTQQNVRVSNELTDLLLISSTKIGDLPVTEKVALQAIMLESKARLDVYKETGHNFLASDDKEKIEQDMRKLQKSLVLSTERQGISLIALDSLVLTDISGNSVSLDSIKKDLQGDYDRSLTTFTSERRNLAAKYGLGTALVSAATAVGIQAAFGTGMFSTRLHDLVTNSASSVNAQDHFALGGKDALNGNVHEITKNAFANPNAQDGSVVIHYGAGTDATVVRVGSLLNQESTYLTKINEVIQSINTMPLSPEQKVAYLHEISNKPWESLWASNGYTNDYLNGIRCLDILEESAKGLADSGNATIHVGGFNCDPALSIAGTTAKNQAERVGSVVLEMTSKTVDHIPGSGSKRWIPIPMFFNTFKRKDKTDDKKAEQKGGNEDDTGNKKIDIKKIPEYKPTVVDPKADPRSVFKDPDWRTDKRVENFKKGYDIKTRGQKIHSDVSDYGTEYPGDGKLHTEDAVMRQLLYSFKGLTSEDRNIIRNMQKQGMSSKQMEDYLTGVISKQREGVGVLKERREYDRILKECYDKIPFYIGGILGENVLEKTNKLIGKDRIHLVGDYDYMNITGDYSRNTLGVFRSLDGDIYISSSYIKQYENSDPVAVGKNKTFPRLHWELKHVLTHEMLHSMSVVNFAEKGNNIIPRRVGLRHINIKRMSDRGIGMNEGTTENLTQNILKMWYEDEGAINYVAPWISYINEQDIFEAAIDSDKEYGWSDLYKAMLLRKESTAEKAEKNTPLFELISKINGGKELNNAKRPYFFELLMNLLDYVNQNRGAGTELVIEFVKTKNINLLQKYFGATLDIVFEKSLLNKTKTNFNDFILSKYKGTPSGSLSS